MMFTRAMCSGSFDPVTYGHIDIFERASQMFDELLVVVFHNIRKQSFFSVDERIELIKESVKHIPNIRVMSFSGLIPDFMHEYDVKVNVRGLRSVTDFEYEMEQAQMLKHLAPDLETVFILTGTEYYFVSSSGVKELASFGGNIKGLVPECVERAIAERSQKDKK